MTERADLPSVELGRQLRYWRTRRKLSASALASRTKEIGATTLTRVAISKIEIGQRGVSVDEWLQLAYALTVPPPLLLLDLYGGTYARIAPDVAIHPWLAWEFIVGDEPPIAPDQTVVRAAEHSDALEVVRLYRRQRDQVDLINQAESAISKAEYAVDASALSAARSRHAEALRGLGSVLADMVSADVQPPAIPQEWIKSMRRLKVLPERVLAHEIGDMDG